MSEQSSQENWLTFFLETLLDDDLDLFLALLVVACDLVDMTDGYWSGVVLDSVTAGQEWRDGGLCQVLGTGVEQREHWVCSPPLVGRTDLGVA